MMRRLLLTSALFTAVSSVVFRPED
eukprot:COSAG02_NODE_27688_length_604_cov_1.538614_1_plen_24_part_10